MALYHQTSGGPVEVKRHQIMGPVGYTVVGSPTIKDGVVSNFTTDNYLTTTAIPSNSDIEFNIVFTVSQAPSDTIGIFCLGNSYYRGILGSSSANSLRLSYRTLGSDSASYKAFNISIGTPITYNMKYYKADHSLVVKATQNNQTILDWSIVGVEEEDFTNRVLLGRTNYDFSNGSIDLNHTYIKVNNELWFYQPQETKYIIREDPSTQVQKLVWADPRIALSGPVNYTVVGSPAIVDGVVSRLSDNDYLFLSGSFSTSDSLEMRLRVKYVGSTSQRVYSATNSFLYFNFADNFIQLRFTNDIILSLYLTITSGDEYDLLIGIKNNVLTFSVTDITSGETDTNSLTIVTPVSVSNLEFGSPNVDYWRGSIDLKNTYIKVNGDLWFYGKNYASANIAPVPSGFTYGTTTTPSIGYVDMRTQQFTAAPEGATIGRDE